MSKLTRSKTWIAMVLTASAVLLLAPAAALADGAIVLGIPGDVAGEGFS